LGSPRSSLAALSLTALALALAAGCSSPPTRKVETRLRPDARIYLGDKELKRDEAGAIEVPIVVSYEYFQEAPVTLTEPDKPPLRADIVVLVNPPAGVEDRLVFETKANSTVVYVGEKGGSIAGATRPVSIFPDPLETLVGPDGGPFELARGAQGVVIVVSDWRATAVIAGLEIPFRPTKDRAATRSLPSFIEAPPGPLNVQVKRGQGVSAPPFMTQVTVRPGEWRLLSVHLGEERPGLAADDPMKKAGAAKKGGAPKGAAAPAKSPAPPATDPDAPEAKIEDGPPEGAPAAPSDGAPDDRVPEPEDAPG